MSKKKFIEVTNIQWETDGEDPDELGLPSSVTLTEQQIDYDIEKQGRQDLDDAISDFLSDAYDFLVDGFAFNVVES